MENRLCKKFGKNSAAAARKRCKPCTSKLITDNRKQDPARLLAYRWYNVLRRHGIRTKQPTQFVKQILAKCANRSVISGEENVEQLCVFPYFRDVPPMEEWNNVIITTREARILSHIRCQDRAHLLFPLSIRQQMQKNRCK